MHMCFARFFGAASPLICARPRRAAKWPGECPKTCVHGDPDAYASS